MAQLVVIASVTIDGVAQAPGRRDEDTRGGFEEGGWAVPYSDSVAVERAGKGMAETSALLFGRRTYEDFHAVWPSRRDGNPFTEMLDRTPKYVVSGTLTSVTWQNSVLLRHVDEIAALKERLPGAIAVLGSLRLVASLGELVDRVVLSIHPLVLGVGARLELPVGPLELVESVSTTTGVVIATFARTRP